MAADRAAPRQLDCWAVLEDWHARWVLAVGVLPALLLGAVALRWLHQRRGGAAERRAAGRAAAGASFFVVCPGAWAGSSPHRQPL